MNKSVNSYDLPHIEEEKVPVRDDSEASSIRVWFQEIDNHIPQFCQITDCMAMQRSGMGPSQKHTERIGDLKKDLFDQNEG